MASGGDTNLDDLGRWTEPAMLVLSSLAGGPKHGYAIIQDVRQIASVTLGPGALAASPARSMRGAVSAAVTLWIAVIVVGAGFAKTTEDEPFRAAQAAHPLLSAARIAVEAIAVAGAVVVVIAGAPLAVSVVR